MKYKLLVLDVDGTLLNNQKEISPRTLAALLKVQQMGVHIVLASGRPTNGVMPIAEKLELNHYGGYILSYCGGQVSNVQSGGRLYEKRIDPEWIPYFEKKAKKNDFAIFTYHKDFILTDKPDNKYVIQEANLNKMQIVGVDNFAEAVDFPPCKCMLARDDEEALIGLENHWKKRLDGVLDAFRSEPYFLEVVPQFIDKGNTLGVLMTKLSVSPEEVIAIGDGVCDVTMLQLAGVGIAMGNAEDSVKACVDKTTLTNEEEGVAVADGSTARPVEYACQTRSNGKPRHPIYICIRRPCRSDHAGRRTHPPAIRHPTWRGDTRIGRNGCRVRIDDPGQTRRNRGRYASQWQPYVICP